MKIKISIITLAVLTALVAAVACGTASKTTAIPVEKRTVHILDHMTYYPTDAKATEKQADAVLQNYLLMTTIEGSVIKSKLESVTIDKKELIMVYKLTTDKKEYLVTLITENFKTKY